MLWCHLLSLQLSRSENLSAGMFGGHLSKIGRHQRHAVWVKPCSDRPRQREHPQAPHLPQLPQLPGNAWLSSSTTRQIQTQPWAVLMPCGFVRPVVLRWRARTAIKTGTLNTSATNAAATASASPGLRNFATSFDGRLGAPSCFWRVSAWFYWQRGRFTCVSNRTGSRLAVLAVLARIWR